MSSTVFQDNIDECWSGWAVVYVDQTNEVHPSHGDHPGWSQEVYETKEQAVLREQELLEVEGGIWEVVEVLLTIRR